MTSGGTDAGGGADFEAIHDAAASARVRKSDWPAAIASAVGVATDEVGVDASSGLQPCSRSSE